MRNNTEIYAMRKNELESIVGKILIYGAHLVALECCRFLVHNGKRNQIEGFAVTDTAGNPEELAGFPVKRLGKYENRRSSLTVIIATPEKYHDEIERHAKGRGFSRFIRVGLGELSRLKGQRLITTQQKNREISFILEEDRHDVSWLNMLERKSLDNGSNLVPEEKCHYKFPTLFYLDEERVFAEAANLDFHRDYEKTCGQYHNLHMMPARAVQEANGQELEKTMNIYMAFSIWDSIKPNGRQYAPWIRPIQVGSSLSDQLYGGLSDDAGEHISGHNRLFAEMTGAYWVWKNAQGSAYKGLCHYRRHFVISDEEIMALQKNGIDVILTTPRYVPGGIKNMFLAETPVKRPVYETMLSAISELSSGDRKNFEAYMDSCFYYPNNMVVARSEIYDRYCAWVFPILFWMAECDLEMGYGHSGDRHIAYAAELLTSYYFVKEKDHYCIAVTDYKFVG